MTENSPFDFAALRSGDAIHTITEPQQLFDALPNKEPGYGYLRQVQAQVLQHWYPRRDERDLVIKANTGGGKTIVGLLILQSSLNESVGSALYVAPDSHLAAQVIQEADALDIETVDDPENTKFIRGEAICVTTVQVLLNGKSRFGIQGSGNRTPIPVGAVIMDDAHAAVSKVDEAFRLVIPRAHAAYRELLDIFEDGLKQQGPNTYLDIVDDDPGAVQRVPFWDWQSEQDRVLELLRPHRYHEDFEWGWPIIADQLELCEVTVSANEIEIKPPCPPIQKFPSFAEAKRRIYMTATLPDDSLLVTHLDADPTSISSSIVPDSASDLGDRLVLAPQEINPNITQDSIRDIAESVAEDWNVVVLAPSWKVARKWQDIAVALVSKPDDIKAEVERLKLGKHVGIVVLVNSYDGIDLPDEACRLLIIDSLPFALSSSERRESMALRDSEAMISRQMQRLEQGIGRAVRSRDDRCAVILTGPRLTQLVSRPDAFNKFSEATKAQLALSRKVANQLGRASTAQIENIIRQVIKGDAHFRALSREELLGVTYSPANVSATSTHLRAAYNAACAQNFSKAADEARNAVDAAEDSALSGWVGETHAAYVNQLSETEAQRVLSKAITKNSVVLKPLSGITYESLKEVTDQATQALEYLTSNYETGDELIIGFEAVLSDIEWDNEQTEQAEAALAELGNHLGFLSQRPEKDYKLGSDVLWSLGQRHYAVIEAKTGATASQIWKKDINQLAGSVNWCQRTYGKDAVVTPVIVHPSNVVHEAGTPPEYCRSINRVALDHLKNQLRKLASALAYNENYRQLAQIQTELVSHKFDAQHIFDEYSVATLRSAN